MIYTFCKVCLVLFLSFVIYACSPETTSNTNVITIDSTVKPKVGSYYNYTKNYYDSLNINKGIVDIFDSVIASGLSYKGKTNVIKVVSSNKNGKDTNYYNFESNGNISFYEDNTLDYQEWITYPLNGNDSIPLTVKDTSYLIGNNDTIFLKTSGYFKNIGVETKKVGFENFNSQKLLGKKFEQYISFGDTLNITYDYIINFSRKLGAQVFYSEKNDDKRQFRYELVLDNYSLRK